MYRYIWLFIVFFMLKTFSAQAIIYEDKIISQAIKSVQLFPKGADMAMPILNMNKGETLELHFDDLSGKPKNYYYTVVQCHNDWTPTSMNIMEYVDGFTEANINDYDYSNGTKVPYVHYKLEFPNNDMQINRSGNYVLLVYENSKDNPIFIKRFMIAEAKVTIDANVVYPRNMSQRNFYQEVIFKVNTKGFLIDNAQMEINATVLQNYRWDNAKINVKPQFYGVNELNFDLNGTLIFPSTGREFRYFDMRSLRFRGQNIRAFDIRDNENDVYLLYDRPTPPNAYQITKDLNGQYYIDNLDNPYYNTGADYANVHFNLDMGGTLSNGNLYVLGAFNNWKCDSTTQLYYDATDKSYTTDILLKQGMYNYTYVFKSSLDNSINPFMTEGNYLDTENDYTILLYYTPFGERYDRLVSVKFINSIINRY
ncbi:MAG TPA: DUF5103 domain-containing protein [Chitinophagales bacterium]|nr:DUF5103 domain-containing protein [Chitinophagales bacterium]